MRYKLAHYVSLIAVVSVFFIVAPTAFGQKMSSLEMEQRLSDLGYWITKVDGKRDDSTRQAIIAFQKVEGRKRTGVLSASDIERLRTATRPTAKFASGPAHVEVDISRQVLLYVGDDGVVQKVI